MLRESGTAWFVLGDKYDGGQLLGIPWRIALAAQDAGWILRSDIIWHKPNAMPSPVRNRPTTDHEYVFLLVKTMQLLLQRGCHSRTARDVHGAESHARRTRSFLPPRQHARTGQERREE